MHDVQDLVIDQHGIVVDVVRGTIVVIDEVQLLIEDQIGEDPVLLYLLEDPHDHLEDLDVNLLLYRLSILLLFL